VLVWLAKKGQRAPAIRLLCSITSFARSTICKALRQLQAVGLILRRPRHELMWLRGVLRNAQMISIVILNDNEPKTVIVVPFKRAFATRGPKGAQLKTPDLKQKETVEIEAKPTNSFRSSSLLSSRLVREGRL
jgi:DNA-binding transcriptional MocR family regulator